MLTTTTQSLNLPQQSEVESSCDGCSLLSLVYFVCSSFIALGEIFKAKAKDNIFRISDNYS